MGSKKRRNDSQPTAKGDAPAPRDSGRRMSFTDVRRRALTLVDVIAEKSDTNPLHVHRMAVALGISWVYWSYVLPTISSWGSGRYSREVRMGVTEARVGGPGADVMWAILVLVTLAYLVLVIYGVRVMERRQPVEKRIFEWMVVYNAVQALLNLRLAVALLLEVWRLGYQRPWGNALDPSEAGHQLGMLIWFQYHCRQLDLLDTLFMILRKKFQRISKVHVYLRLLNLWCWFLACRYACGGDTYFPAMVNAMCQVIVYLYYFLHLVRPSSLTFFRRSHVAEMQVLQFMICTAHAVYCLVSGNIPRAVVAFNLFVMATGLAFYVDFDGENPRLGRPRLGPRPPKSGKNEGFTGKVTLCFDSCGWLYSYHFGVAMWVAEHMLPEGLTTADCETDRYPEGLGFSGSSGGSLVAGALGSGINISDLFEYVLLQRESCRAQPLRIFAALEGALDKFLPANSARSLSGRVRVLLTRLSLKPPFVTGEIVDQYSDRSEVWHTMRASCHIPGIYLKPYKLNSRFYFDGLLWSSFFVPWASDDSHTIRVSALSRPLTDISAPIQPMWWALFPPPVDVLRGLFWTGYRDAARYFSEKPPTDPLELCKCRARPDQLQGGKPLPELDKQKLKHQAAQKLIIRGQDREAPTVDPITGREVAELMKCYTKSVERNLIFIFMCIGSVVVGLLAAAF